MDDLRLRAELTELLRGGNAHAGWDQALKGLTPAHRSHPPGPGLHSVWQLLEHVRIAQEDILRYTLEAGWTSPEWPEGYWPKVEKPSAGQWQESVAAFQRDLEAVVALVNDPGIDLTASIPHGEGRTYLREALLVADHNAYHCAQAIDARRLLKDWKGR
ncbi:MAG TPA: DinB family protein [Vicinamibacteria bacterium]|nr:DinB family protein [Vicinamibacteria bacterium]